MDFTADPNPSDDAVMLQDRSYHGLLPREDMKTLLRRHGDFLTRMSEPRPNESRQYILSVMCDEAKGEIRHYVIARRPLGYAVNPNLNFKSIQLLISYYVKNKTPLMDNHPTAIIKQPIPRQPWELDHKDIESTKKLGEGAFGEVHRGNLRRPNSTEVIPVAIKVAKLEAMTKEQIKELMREARVMRTLDHPNVVKTHGVAAGMDPIQIVMELASDGALNTYLKDNEVTMEKKAEMCMQAAFGIDYLHNRNIIHRDLAARNCLYGDGKVKISDFGLSREGPLYQMDAHKRVPIRWLAPETIRVHVYTTKTDVFSYGIMCWEIYHNGREPYTEMTPNEAAIRVKDGYRMPFEVQIQPEVLALITLRVWMDNPSERIAMADVCCFFERLYGINRPEPGPGISLTPIVPATENNSHNSAQNKVAAVKPSKKSLRRNPNVGGESTEKKKRAASGQQQRGTDRSKMASKTKRRGDH